MNVHVLTVVLKIRFENVNVSTVPSNETPREATMSVFMMNYL